MKSVQAMISQRGLLSAHAIRTQNARGLRALAILLLLTFVPHILHLPVWISVLGVSIVGLRLLAQKQPTRRSLQLLLSPMFLTLLALASAFLIRAHYGYFLGRDPCVAFLFLLVAAKFAEIRRSADATLLLCLAAFLLLTQYFYSQTILSALITLPAVLALGNALAVLRDPSASNRTRDNLQLVGKLLLQGAPLAALLFIVFPRLPGPLWSVPEDAMAQTGLSDSMTPGSISELSQSDEVAFRVEFDGPVPPSNARYWRGPVLTDYDGRRWSVNPRLVEARPATAKGDALDYTVMLQPHRQRWLFALDQATSLPMSSTTNDQSTQALARMTADGQLLRQEPVSQVLRYRQQSQLQDSYRPRQKPPLSTLQLADKNKRTVAHAIKMRARVDNDRAYANAIMTWFNQEQFHYTLQPSLLGDSPVDEFLFTTREGFCEHYAAAFVVLMRAAGIPARVVTGYLGGEMNGDYMIVRQSDAHAWAEAFIGGRWQRFDPTAAVAPSRVETGMASALGDDSLVPRMARLDNSWTRRMQLSWDAINHDWQRLVIDFDNDSQFAVWQRLGLPEPKLWQIVVLVIVAASGWCLLVLGLPRWQSPNVRGDERAWGRFCQLLTKQGVARGRVEGPSSYLQRARLALPAQAQRIDRVGSAINDLRFFPLSDPDRRSRWQLVRRELPLLAVQLWVNRLLRRRAPQASATEPTAARNR